MSTRRKYSKGDSVKFRGLKWTVCKGGRSNPSKKIFEYKISRGSWREYVGGSSLSRMD